MGFMDGVKSFFGSGQPSVKSANLLTPEQRAYQNQLMGLGQQYMPQMASTLFGMGTTTNNVYDDLTGQGFTDNVVNPTLNMRESLWQNNAAGLAGGGKFHSGAMTRQRGLFDTETANNLAGQRWQADLQQRQGLENAYGRQMSAMNSLGGLFGGGMNIGKENIVSQNKSPFDYIMQAGQLGVMGGKAYAGA